MGTEPARSDLGHDLPPREELTQLMKELDENGLREFLGELLDVIYTRPEPAFTKTVAAWHRSLRFLATPGFRAQLEAARSPFAS